MGVVHSTKGAFEPCSEHLKSEPAIVCELARALMPYDTFWQGLENDYDQIRNWIEKSIPGFDDYNRRVRNPNGFDLPNPAREGKFIEGKAYFTVNELPDIDVEEGQLVMMTIRSHDQYNTTIYGLNDRYRGIFNERRVILLHKQDMIDRGLIQGSHVNIIGEYQGETRRANGFIAVPFDIPQGCCATYFPEANALVPLKSVAKESNTPASKFVEIRLEKV